MFFSVADANIKKSGQPIYDAELYIFLPICLADFILFYFIFPLHLIKESLSKGLLQVTR